MKLLLFGPIGGVAGQTVIATVSLNSLEISYQKTLPSITTIGWFIYLGVFVSADKFYIGNAASSVFTDPSGTFQNFTNV